MQKQKRGLITWQEFYKEIISQYGSDEHDAPLSALANLKQTGTVIEYHQAFIELGHLVEDTQKNFVSLFLSGLREDLRAKVKLDKPLTVVSANRSACV